MRHSLLPRHGLSLVAFAGDGARFARLFQGTWRRVPLGARRQICRHWRREDPATGRHGRPFVELIACCRALWQDDDERMSYASVNQCGWALYFNSEAFDAMPDDVACDVIAHELAHVFQWSERPLGREAAMEAISRYREFPFDDENDADELIAWWGFDPESVDRWSLAVGRTKAVVLEDTPENWRLVMERMLRRGR